ncbi:MAG: riboflavin synthase [Fibrobacterota bacterium]
MFTGIAEETGILKEKIRQSGDVFSVKIDCDKVIENTSEGDSIMVNGICLTVENFSNSFFEASVVSETAENSAFRTWRPGRKLNLERALTPSSRMGGHIVQGHVDCTAVLSGRSENGGQTVLEFRVPEDSMKYIVRKGSVAIDGISLTVSSKLKTGFSVALIPHTLSKTALRDISAGEEVNIETDIVGHYIESLLSYNSGVDKTRQTGLSGLEDKLREYGF